MRNHITRVITGLLFISVGVILFGNMTEWWDIDLFFNGWWTLFFILPALLSMINSNINLWNSFLLLCGVMLLLNENDLLGNFSLFRLLFVFALVFIGVRIIFQRSQLPKNNTTEHSDSGNGMPINQTEQVHTGAPMGSGKVENITAIFSGVDRKMPNTVFEGANITAIFGGVDLDLRDAIIDHDIHIEVTNIFGGTDLRLPSNVKCILNDTPILGGCDCKFRDSTNAFAPRVYIKSTSILGGMDVR